METPMFMLSNGSGFWSRTVLPTNAAPAWKPNHDRSWRPLTFVRYKEAEIAALSIQRSYPAIQVEIV